MIERVSIKEAAERLGVSQDTIRRRLKSGELAGEREKTPQGFVWCVELPQGPSNVDAAAGEPTATASAPLGDGVEVAQLRERVAGLERLAEELKGERDAWREQAQRDGEAARELRVLLRNEQMWALPQETTRQDAPGATGTPAHDIQVIERRASLESTRRSFWDWLRRR
jgi:hypothetical protein